MLASKTPLLSIITISKDDPVGLLSTVESVKEQSHGDYELIVVRSGSSQSLDLCAIDSRTVVIDEPPRGISRAFNSAIARARGDWIQFLNGGDTFLDADALLDLAASCKNDVDMVLSFAVVKGRGTTIPRDVLGQWSYGFLYASHQASLFHRRLFDGHGQFSTEFQVRMDLEWLSRLPAGAAYTFVDRRTVLFDTTGVSGERCIRSVLEEIVILWRNRALRHHVFYPAFVVLPYRLLRHVWRKLK